MKPERPATSAGLQAVRWRVLAAVLAVVSLVCLVAWLAQPSPTVTAVTPQAPTSTSSPVTTSAPPSTSADEPGLPAVAPPVHLTIPAIGVSTSLVRLGLQPDRTVEVPTEPAKAGWFDLGTPPGAVGSSVIVGHVDSRTGPAVFYRLKELTPGQRLTVGRADGSAVDFEVTAVATYLNESFPARKVYAARGGTLLNLVTCGGAYDSSKGGYQSNVVVYTHMVGTSVGPG